jgi:hypothetical protein
MGDVEEAWAADMLYGCEPSSAPPTETLVVNEREKTSGAAESGAAAATENSVQLDAEPRPDESAPPDANAGAKKTAIVLGAALLGAVAVIVTALVTFSNTAPAMSVRPTPSTAASAAPVPTTALPQADQDQVVPYTASANCPAGSTSAQALIDTISDSAWVCVRGAQGATVDGQLLHVDFGRSFVLSAVTVTPGWIAKTPGGKDEWLQHRVVTRLQYIFNDTDRTVFTQDTGNAHGPVTTPLPRKVLASRVTVVILQTARPPASPLPSVTQPALPGFGDSVLGPDGAPLAADSTVSTDPPLGDASTDPVDATFAVSALKFLGHEPN